MDTIICACGCGTERPRRSPTGRIARFVNGHNARLPTRERQGVPCKCGCGATVITPDQNGRERQFRNGHVARLMTPAKRAVYDRMIGKPSWNKGRSYVIDKGHPYATTGTWMQAMRRWYGDRCMRCGWSEASCDAHHIVAKSEGGPHTLENGVVLCPNCHRVTHQDGVERAELERLRVAATPLVEAR